jgi:hypothetical protein
MSKVTSEGKVKAYFLPSVADISAPTVAEITAGTNLTPQLPTAGLEISFTENNASVSMIDEGFTAEAVGTYGATAALTFTRDSVAGDDDAWTLFERGLEGFLLISRFGTPAAASRVEVYPIESHNPTPLAPAENDFQKMRVTLAVNAEPDLKAVVAA